MRLLLIILSIFSIGRTNAQPRNFLDTIRFSKAKPTLFYTVASWCKENLKDYEEIRDTMIKYRDSYSLILLLDTVKTAKFNYSLLIDNLKSDQYVVLTDVYPKRFVALNENKKFTKQINEHFHLQLYRLGPASLLMIKDKKAISVLFENRAQFIADEMGRQD